MDTARREGDEPHGHRELAPGYTEPADVEYVAAMRGEIVALRRAIDRDHVGMGELLVWFLGVTAVMCGMHYAFAYWGGPGKAGPPVAKPEGGAETTVWVGRIGKGGYCLLQLPVEQPEVAKFRDAPLASAYGGSVRTYWLGLYAFGDAPLAIDVGTAVATVGGAELPAKPLPKDLPPSLAIQLAGLAAPVALAPGTATRALLVFADHDPAALSRLTLATPEGPVVLEPARRKLTALEAFNELPNREFFESIHAHTEPKK